MINHIIKLKLKMSSGAKIMLMPFVARHLMSNISTALASAEKGESAAPKITRNVGVGVEPRALIKISYS